ncbi:trafficking protein particle complex subunit 12 [Maniola hyperantus]|uniref:trafficking protein particle complex subunit 12 n=1 Tax=Aphantopus hyperantus TaxID=2795564 RepID=UPI0015681F2B|nr:trafficking protein particle complex subunit 12 isoform X1 [Maniola hyperantus]XP_034826336.1 trafficking protein particle complex subunit 12 isoform X1 [Maniola hyperantus]
MDKPNLSQYFGGSEVPPASQFFDEIGTSPSDMIQSVYLGDSEGTQPITTGAFPTNMTTSFTEHRGPQEISFTNVLPTVSGSTAIPATSLPDPSTFFDTIGPEPQIGPNKINIVTPSVLTEAMDGLSIKNQPVDKEADRRRDAWIPSEEANKTLLKAQSSPKGSFFPDREVLTMPGLVLEEELADALQEVAVKYLGVSSAGSRGVVRAEHVSRDEAGLRELLRTGYLRAAINLTATLISAAGQGAGRMHRPTKHTPRSLQLWLTRFAVMCRIKLYEPLAKEAEPFGDFSKPDMFYQFYPDAYESRTGSLVPFSLRLLIAELPAHVGKPEEAMDRLYAMLEVIQHMISNLNEEKTEDGSGTITLEDKTESLRLWTGRQTRVLHSVVNCAIALKDYRLATKILTTLRDQSTTPQQQRALSSALCRVALLAGHVKAALLHSFTAKEARHHICPTPDVREYVDLGLIDIAHGKYQDAYNNFARAADQEPTNIMVANNLAVCLLYMGRLKEAISVLQKAIHADPERGLNESLLINLCTLYELESSKTHEKKLNLLRMLCKHKSDTIPNVLECLKLT